MAGKKRGTLVDVAEIGRKGGLNSRINLDPEHAAELGRKAVNARWEAYYAAHPAKLRAKLEREARKGKLPRGRPPAKKKAR
jgi:hypothetical protein